MNAKQLSKITEEAKRLIQSHIDKGNTINSLAVESKVNPIQIWKFMRGEQGLTDTTLAKIGKAIAASK